jgi:uncharacterized protein (DUF2147 family)
MRRATLTGLLMLMSMASFAKDTLADTTWQTIDDVTGQPKALVHFNEIGHGALGATVLKLVDKNAKTICQNCPGSLKNKPIVGLRIVQNLKPVEGKPNQYEDGVILDPHNGKTYSLKGELSPDGKTLNLRGYLGISLLGRNQVWQRVDDEK